MDAMILLSFAYVAGLLSMMAPCAFAMLPSYIAWYLSREGGKESPWNSLKNGTLATLGGGTVMGAIGLLTAFSIRTASGLVYFKAIIGLILVIMGMLMLADKGIGIRLPVTLDKRKGALGVYIFGAFYSLASMGCVASVFIGMILVASTTGPGLAVGSVLVYIAGMGTILIPLTFAISSSKTLMLKRLENFMPYVKKVAGIILVCMGIYLVVSML